jgi:hypothetical protein
LLLRSLVARGRFLKREIGVMKKVLAFLVGILGRARLATEATHDDSLRANQGQDSSRTFSFWRALVS